MWHYEKKTYSFFRCFEIANIAYNALLAYLKAPNQATELGTTIILIANKEGIEIPWSLTLWRDGRENLILYIAEREVLGEFSGSYFFEKRVLFISI
jgi:hypothetical protein